MIHSIRLQNFQSHKDTHLEFLPGVNVIIGPSRHGKTAIIRALRWVMENRPAGDEFKSHWAGKEPTIVSIKLTSGEEIIRSKSDSLNSYLLNGESFIGFGQDVPKPVAEILNLDPINTQYQFDQPFLLFDSPGAVARYLNQVVHLEKIDTALANITSLKRQNDQDIRSQEVRITELSILEASFPDLIAAEEFIADLERAEKAVQEKLWKISQLTAIQDKLHRLQIELKRTEIPVGIEAKVVSLNEKQTHKVQLEYTRNLLAGLQSKLVALRKQKQILVPALEQESWVQELLTRNHLLQEKKKRLTKLKMFKQQIDSARLELSKKTTIIKQGEIKFEELMPEQCPLCGK